MQKKPLIAAVLTILAAGCTTTSNVSKVQIGPLEGAIRAAKFVPFRPPRSGDGAGTIVNFNWKGEESPLVAADCLTGPSNQVKRISVAILDTSYDLTNSATADFDMGKILGPKLQLAAALSLNSVKSVKLTLTDPFQDEIYEYNTKLVAHAMTNSDSCIKSVGKNDLVLHTVLGAKGVSYQFIGSGGRLLSLDATIMNQIKLDPKLQSSYQGKGSLDLTNEIFLGYRAWKVKVVSGLVSPEVTLQDLSPEETEALRASASKPDKK